MKNATEGVGEWSITLDCGSSFPVICQKVDFIILSKLYTYHFQNYLYNP